MGVLFDLLGIFEKIAIEYFTTCPSNMAKVTIN
jgi:hypothetical protein